MPEGGLADGNARLLDEDQKNPRPKSRAVNFASGPQIVGDEREQKNVGESAVNGILTVEKIDRQTSDGGDEKSRGGQQDVTFVSRRIGTGTERTVDESGKEKHIRERDDVKHSWIAANGVVGADQRVRCCHHAEHHHKASEKKTRDA